MRLVILGGGGHAAVFADLLALLGQHQVLGFMDDDPTRTLPGLRHLGPVRPSAVKLMDCAGVVLGVGKASLRSQWFALVRSEGLALPALVHPWACVSQNAELHDGAVVMAGAVVQSRAILAEGVIINTGASVDHDARVGAFSHIAPGARLAGGVRIGARCLIGLLAGVIEGCEVGDDALVAAGAMVTRDVAAGARVAGVPARPLPKGE